MAHFSGPAPPALEHNVHTNPPLRCPRSGPIYIYQVVVDLTGTLDLDQDRELFASVDFASEAGFALH